MLWVLWVTAGTTGLQGTLGTTECYGVLLPMEYIVATGCFMYVWIVFFIKINIIFLNRFPILSYLDFLSWYNPLTTLFIEPWRLQGIPLEYIKGNLTFLNATSLLNIDVVIWMWFISKRILFCCYVMLKLVDVKIYKIKYQKRVMSQIFNVLLGPVWDVPCAQDFRLKQVFSSWITKKNI